MMTNPKIDFFVEGIPVPATRKSQRDKWASSAQFEREKAWRGDITLKARYFKSQFKNLKYPIMIQVLICSPKPLRGDGDNYFKAAVDALVYDDLIPNDNLARVQIGSFQWIKLDKSGMKIMIFEAIGDTPF